MRRIVKSNRSLSPHEAAFRSQFVAEVSSETRGLLGLDRTADLEIRKFAGENGFIMVTKDADYSELHSLFGAPPKIIWIRHGNCSTRAIENILRDNFDGISRLIKDDDSGVLTIY